MVHGHVIQTREVAKLSTTYKPRSRGLTVCPAALAPDHTASYLGISGLRVLSLNHNTISIDDLADLALDAESVARLRGEFMARGIHAVVLATCNRIEIFWEALGPEDVRYVARAFASKRSSDGSGTQSMPFMAQGIDAARHLFRVACGLESLLVGEFEIMGQVRDAIEGAESTGEASPLLSTSFAAALRCGGRARAETAISTGALSVASSAVALLGVKSGDLSGLHALVVGAGQTGLRVSRRLMAEKIGSVVLANRMFERARSAARTLGCESTPLSALARHLTEVDAVFIAVSAPEFVLTADGVREAMRARDGRPLTVIDLSMPRAADPALADLPGVSLFGLSSLEEQVRMNRMRRECEIPQVEKIIDTELCELISKVHNESIRPLITELCVKVEAIRKYEVERALADGVQNPEDIERVTKRLVGRLIADPLTALRGGRLGLDEGHAEYLRHLFGLDRESWR